jgi:hypothetical protein
MSATLNQAGPILSPTVLASGWNVQFTVPTGCVAKIFGWDQCNKDTSNPETVSIAIGTGDVSHVIQPPTVIAPLTNFPRYRDMWLRAGQTLHSNAVNGSRVVWTIHGVLINL